MSPVEDLAYLALFASPALVTAGLAAYAFGRPARGARAYAVFMGTEALWMAGYVIELWSPALSAKVAWDHVQYVGLLMAVPAFIAFVLSYTGRPLRHPRRFWALFSTLTVAFAAALVLEPGGLRDSARLVAAWPHPVLTYEFTALDYAVFALTYAAMLRGLVLLLRHGRAGGRLARAQVRVIALGAALPMAGGVVTLAGMDVGGHRDLSPFAFGLGHAILAWGLFRHQLFAVVPIARDAVLEQLGDPVLVLDEDGRLLDVNPAGARLLGGEPAVRLGARAAASLPDWLLPLATGEPTLAERDFETPGPERPVWYRVKATPLRDARGHLLGRVLQLSDITLHREAEQALRRTTDELERHVEARTAELLATNARLHQEIVERVRAETALRESERRFRAIFDNTFQLTGLLSRDGRLLEANRTAFGLIGGTPDDVLGRPFWETPWWSHDPTEALRLRAAIARAAAGELVRYEATHVGRDGEPRRIDFSLKPVRDDAGDVVLLIPEGRDITERHRAEETRRALEAELAHAQRLESIGRLAGGVAHDLNNLLTVILGNAALVPLELPNGAPPPPSLAEIRRAGESAATLVRQLLAFGRKQSTHPRVVDLNALVDELRGTLTHLLGDQVSLSLALARPLGAVRLDPGQLEQVLVNLAVNARDAMPRGGRLSLETADILLDRETCLRLPEATPGPWVRLTVRDTGTGLSDEARAHLFEPFFTTKPVGRGTGLGLAIVHGIVHQSGGFITVESGRGVGTAFVIHLPRAAPTFDGLEAPPAPTPPGGAGTILLAEDQEGVRRVAATTLERLGYRVLAHPSGESALEAARTYPDRIDLLLTDVVMPGLDGPALAEAVRALRPEARVLFVSGFAPSPSAATPSEPAEVSMLPKPFTPAALGAKVREVLGLA